MELRDPSEDGRRGNNEDDGEEVEDDEVDETDMVEGDGAELDTNGDEIDGDMAGEELDREVEEYNRREKPVKGKRMEVNYHRKREQEMVE